MSDEKLLFTVHTPLGFDVRVTIERWTAVTTKHPAMLGCENEIRLALEQPEAVRRSRSDPEVAKKPATRSF